MRITIGLIVACLFFCSSCKNHKDNTHDDTGIFISAFTDETDDDVIVVVGLPIDHYAIVYIAPDGVAKGMLASSGQINLGQFMPGNYEVCMVLYLAGTHPPDTDYNDGNTYPYPHWENDDSDFTNHSGERWCTSFVVK